MTATDQASAPWAGALVRNWGGRDWVMGIDWRAPAERRVGAAARAAVKASPGALAVVRREHSQFGLGPAAAKGAMAAAAVLVEAGPGSWIGLWKIDDDDDGEVPVRYWGVAAAGGVIYPLFGDVVLGDAAAAREWLERARHRRHWDREVLPPDWSEEARTTVSGRPGQIFEQRRSGPRLGRQDNIPVRTLAVAVAVMTVTATTALIIWDRWFDAVPAPVRLAAETPVKPPLPPPDAVKPDAALSACLTAMGQVWAVGVPAGWRGQKLTCQVATGGATAEHHLMAESWIPLVLTADWRPPEVKVDLRARRGRVVADAPLPVATPVAPVPEDEALTALSRLAELMGGALGRNLNLGNRRPRFNAETHTAPRWRELTWRFETDLAPGLWVAGIGQLSGALIESVELTDQARVWSIRGSTVVGRGHPGGGA